MKTTGRKASPKTASQPPAATPKASRAAPLKKAAAAVVPAAPAASPNRRPPKARTPVVLAAPIDPVGTSKQARLVALLGVLPGATIDQMMTLTGWQAHTVRGTISGVLRKKLGLNVTCEVRDGSGRSLYRIVGTAVNA